MGVIHVELLQSHVQDRLLGQRCARAGVGFGGPPAEAVHHDQPTAIPPLPVNPQVAAEALLVARADGEGADVLGHELVGAQAV